MYRQRVITVLDLLNRSTKIIWMVFLGSPYSYKIIRILFFTWNANIKWHNRFLWSGNIVIFWFNQTILSILICKYFEFFFFLQFIQQANTDHFSCICRKYPYLCSLQWDNETYYSNLTPSMSCEISIEEEWLGGVEFFKGSYLTNFISRLT